MHHRSTAALTTVAALVAVGVLAPPPASAAGSYAVSIRSSRSVADVGQVTVLSGKVTGAGSARKLVAVDARAGTGAWKRLGTTRTTKKGTYAFRATVSSAGTMTYRVVAPRSRTVATGTSKAVTLQTWRWLDLYDQPYLSGGGVVSRGVHENTTIGGKKPPAHTFGAGENAYLYWNVAQQCDRLVAQVGLSDSDQPSTRGVRFQQDGGNTDLEVTGGQGLQGFANLSALSVNSFVVARPDNLYVYVVLPRAHCKVNALPVAID